ncbi:hypothetical protein F9C11_00880 [Amycolatopsis sp. VS8301801F10]|uniref:hypothetical protein n=1 Tax=Amycolatopsis sp. VS8301801F10 TaxID=2652442 RepID=UPI0038FBFCE6
MISIRIDRVVLTGLAEEPGQLRDAVRAELARLLADEPPRGWRASRRRRVVVPESSAGTLAEAIASAIHRGIREVAG